MNLEAQESVFDKLKRLAEEKRRKRSTRAVPLSTIPHDGKTQGIEFSTDGRLPVNKNKNSGQYSPSLPQAIGSVFKGEDDS